MAKMDRDVAIAGIGWTDLTRTPQDKTEIELGIEACSKAAVDAGLDPTEIDGICIQVHHYPPPETAAIAKGLGMKEINWQQDGGTLGIGAVGLASEVLLSGKAKNVVICKIMNTLAPVATPDIDPESGAVPGVRQFEVPYGLGYTMQMMAMFTQRYMHSYGLTQEQLGWLSVTERAYAVAHPNAMQKKLITLDDYMSSRWIAEPVHLFDCDSPTNGACAFLATTGDRARSLRHPPVYLRGYAPTVGAGIAGVGFHMKEEPAGGMTSVAEDIYTQAGMGPKDIDIVYPYDGFTMFVPWWLEDMGLFKRGEAGSFIEGGKRIGPDGELPLNTHGGNLSAGRMHGQHHVLEAVDQLRKTAGTRQVKKAIANAVVTAAFPNGGGAAGILSVDR